MKHWCLIISICVWSLSSFGSEHLSHLNDSQEIAVMRSSPIPIHTSRKTYSTPKNSDDRINYLNPEFDQHTAEYVVAVLAYPYKRVVYSSDSDFSKQYTSASEDEKSDSDVSEQSTHSLPIIDDQKSETGIYEVDLLDYSS